ncbi:thioesterase domain-containing protein [Gemmata obscuriglobus]|nr:thioesterase domain-containing protein [Gemmata obscuriglobus]
MWFSCGLLATALALAGCTLPCHKGYEKALENGVQCELPTPCRNRVHLFMVHGLTPSTHTGLNALRLQLGENGFAKVGIGEFYHAWWVKSEIECIRKNDPDARFVLLGYDYGAGVALSLARDLTAKGAAVDAVVLLDPKGCAPEPCGVHTLLITNGMCTERVPHSARVMVPDATHFTLPAHPTTVAAVADLLRNIAERHCEPEIEEVPVWSYPNAPEPHSVAPVRGTPPEWNFLADRAGPTRAIGTQTATRPVAKPPAVATTAPVPVSPVPVATKR